MTFVVVVEMDFASSMHKLIVKSSLISLRRPFCGFETSRSLDS